MTTDEALDVLDQYLAGAIKATDPRVDEALLVVEALGDRLGYQLRLLGQRQLGRGFGGSA